MDDHKCINRNNYLFVSTDLNASLISLFLLSLFYILLWILKNILNLQGLRSEQSNKGRFKTAWNHLKELKM